jgi:hypothetical protein
MALSTAEKVRQVHINLAAQDRDPWRMKLERLRGKIGNDGIERITTQSIYDFLSVPSRRRVTAANRRLAMIMNDLGWTALRVRGLNCGGAKDRVRGYIRPAHVLQS